MTEPLTPRERQVYNEIATGALGKDVARRLGISLHTLNSHRESIKRKYEVQGYCSLAVHSAQRRVEFLERFIRASGLEVPK